MRESDEERIARLTQLARRAWPDFNPGDGSGSDGFYFGDHDAVCLRALGRMVLRVEHPRALDALQAALLTLAGVLDVPSLEFADDLWEDHE